MPTPQQVAAARALVGISQTELAKISGLSYGAVSQFERGGRSTTDTVDAITRALLPRVDFIGEDGVKLRNLETKTYYGQEGLIQFMNLVYETARDVGGEFCVSNVDEALFTQRFGEEEDAIYTEKMQKLKNNFSFRVLIKEGDTNLLTIGYYHYRWVPKEQFNNIPFYVFGDYLAFLIFDKETTIHVIHNEKIAQAQRTQFDLAWNAAKEVVNA